jgi:hypothetical protein
VNVHTPFKTTTSDYAVVMFRATHTTHRVTLYHDNISPTGVALFSEVSVKEITDWSKLVYFDDPNGTVPVFSALQSTRGRGLLLDRSRGLVRGAELVLNGTNLVDTANWVAVTATISAFSGGLSVTGTGPNARGEQINRPSGVGKWFYLTANVQLGVGVTSARIDYAKTSDGSSIVSAVANTSGTVRMYVQGIESTCQVKCRIVTGTGTVVFSDISVKEVLGNHMVQPTSTARGEISRRVNRLTNTSFTLGAVGTIPTDWIERGNVIGRILDDAASPSGKAMRITVSVGGGIASTSDIRTNSTDLVSGASVTVRILAKSVSGTTNLAWAAAVSTGLIPLTSEYEWKEVTFVASSTTNGLFLGASGVGVFDVAAVDMRLTADAIPSIPSYQAVRSATDYDEVGFPAYWRGQTDDWAKARINPNGATKVLVMTAVQKMSTGTELYVEHGNRGTFNAGTFSLFVSGTKAGFTAHGTVLPSGDAEVTMLITSRAALLAYGNIPTDYRALTSSTGVTGSQTNDVGIGSFTEQDTFFGSRTGTILFANYREYAPPLIIFMQTADPGPSIAQIKRMQRKFAKAIGVTL